MRRATLDDLPVLKGMWEVNRLPVLELERHLTEFQVVERQDGVVVGTIALRPLGAHGIVHSEAYQSAQQEEAIRAAAWERIQVLARNQGIGRLWMRGELKPSWQSVGFTAASAEDLRRFTAAASAGTGRWSTFRLLDQSVDAQVIAQELELFHRQASAENERLRRQALLFKWLAGIIALGFLAGALWLFYTVLSRGNWRRRQ